MSSPSAERGNTTPGLQRILRVEGAFELLIALALYAHLGASWTTFLICFFAPDLAFVAY